MGQGPNSQPGANGLHVIWSALGASCFGARVSARASALLSPDCRQRTDVSSLGPRYATCAGQVHSVVKCTDMVSGGLLIALPVLLLARPSVQITSGIALSLRVLAPSNTDREATPSSSQIDV